MQWTAQLDSVTPGCSTNSVDKMNLIKVEHMVAENITHNTNQYSAVVR